MYALSLNQITNAIKVGGNKRTILVQGDMGTGKSSILNMLSSEMPSHTPCYFDCTTKDLVANFTYSCQNSKTSKATTM